ncbi:MAG: PilZ domain-containing protein [Candidatus Omnitrophica bacterium]|nr:PilZ domain-containing protein [Candidatus Omnitrophota bacterium]
MPEEKRKAVRIKSSLFIQYGFTVGTEPAQWDISTVKDISETGVSLLTGKSFNPGDTLILRLKVPSRPFALTQVTGRVVGSSDAGTGTAFLTRIEFKDLDEDTKTLFHEYVAWVIRNAGEK